MNESTQYGAWHERPTLTGRRVTLRPLDQADADRWLDALGAPADAAELWRGMTVPLPTTTRQAHRIVADHLARQEDHRSVCFTQVAASGELAGITTYYDIDPAQRALAIGWTWIARPYWASGLNAESKLLLLERAFDVLGAVRVVWHVDIRNARSQAAVSKLGAVREGVLRKHKLRPDGTWRDTVLFAMTDDEWPVNRERLRERVAAEPAAGPDPATVG